MTEFVVQYDLQVAAFFLLLIMAYVAAYWLSRLVPLNASYAIVGGLQMIVCMAALAVALVSDGLIYWLAFVLPVVILLAATERVMKETSLNRSMQGMVVIFRQASPWRKLICAFLFVLALAAITALQHFIPESSKDFVYRIILVVVILTMPLLIFVYRRQSQKAQEREMRDAAGPKGRHDSIS